MALKQNNQNLIFKILLLENTQEEIWHTKFIKILPQYSIDTPLEICHFFAQIMHETLNLTALEEKFNYSKESLLKQYSKYFNMNNIDIYYRNYQKIANKIYANRMGNSNEESGDGFKYKGRGIIQLTGKDNYLHFAKYLEKNPIYANIDIMNKPELIAQDKNIAIISGCFFWQKNNLNIYAKEDNLEEIRKKINGGKNGLLDCEERLERYKLLIN